MKKMYTPLQIAGMEIKNRTFMAPMSLGYESQDGTVNEKMAGYWLRRAKGGVGCIIVDATSVDPNVPYLGNTLCFRDEESIKKYKSFTDQIHAYGCKIIPQITHPGPESVSAFYGIPPVASSVYPNAMAQMTRELAKEELPGIIALYAKAGKAAKDAGFDGIELHCIFAHAFENPQNVFSRGMGYFLIVYQLLHFLCTDAGVYAVMQRFTMLISCLYGVFIG